MNDDASATVRRTFQSAVDRWASVGPYYAMFPVEFAFRVVERYSSPGDSVLDPFAGRASSVYAAAALGRCGYGVEINPVGWLYGVVKLQPATQACVLIRLEQIAKISKEVRLRSAKLPSFFLAAYSPEVRRFLLAARSLLDWRGSRTDATLMAFILIYLHGKRTDALSNQMRDGKAMSPHYAIRWWQQHSMGPPRVDPVKFLSKRIAWRYCKGTPAFEGGTVQLGDSVEVLPEVSQQIRKGSRKPFDLLFTSPPYFAITNYHYDQWLRLWMLGGPTLPQSPGGKHRGKFDGAANYTDLIVRVFQNASMLLSKSASVYVRTDAREFTLNTTLAALREAFPKKRLTKVPRPLTRHTQTALFGDRSQKPGEVDIILAPL